MNQVKLKRALLYLVIMFKRTGGWSSCSRRAWGSSHPTTNYQFAGYRARPAGHSLAAPLESQQSRPFLQAANGAYIFEAETGTLFLLNYKDFQMT